MYAQSDKRCALALAGCERFGMAAAVLQTAAGDFRQISTQQRAPTTWGHSHDISQPLLDTVWNGAHPGALTIMPLQYHHTVWQASQTAAFVTVLAPLMVVLSSSHASIVMRIRTLISTAFSILIYCLVSNEVYDGYIVSKPLQHNYQVSCFLAMLLRMYLCVSRLFCSDA